MQREALLEFGAYFFGITQEDLDQQVKMRPLYYDAQRDAYCDLNYDYSYQFAEINATEKMGLIRYTENEDGTLTLEVVTKSMDSWEGYCNYPTLLTVDFSAGHRCSARRSSPTLTPILGVPAGAGGAPVLIKNFPQSCKPWGKFFVCSFSFRRRRTAPRRRYGLPRGC